MAYGHLPLLDDASLRVEPRERVCVTGRNGTGKSKGPNNAERKAFSNRCWKHVQKNDSCWLWTGRCASLAINASGAVRTKTVVLLTPEEIDRASKKGTTYQPPGR